MPTYAYKAVDRNGDLQTGSFIAADESELRQRLRLNDLFVIEVKIESEVAAAVNWVRPSRRRVKLNDMVVMSRQFATLVRSGLTVVHTLSTVADQTENPTLADVLRQVRLDVLGGASLAHAMSQHPKVFTPIFTSLVQAGEAGGTLDQTLETAADMFNREQELREQVKSAMTYPILVIVAAVLVVAFMLGFIVPVFEKVYQQFRADLPAITQFLVLLSHLVVSYGWLVILVGIAIYFLFRRYVATDGGRHRLDAFKLRLPIVGKLIRKIAICRFTQTMAGLSAGGVPVLNALTVAANTSGNVIVRDAVMRVAEHVKQGTTIADPLTESGEFPPMVTRMVASGEQSENLDEMLEEITKFYRRDIEYSVQRLTRLLEPAMTVFVGGIVLFVLLALYMPIFNLSQVLRR
jgi:type IV pilus assembly protein PilC